MIEGHFTKAVCLVKIEKLNDLIDLSLQALDYYHKYNKFYLG